MCFSEGCKTITSLTQRVFNEKYIIFAPAFQSQTEASKVFTQEYPKIFELIHAIQKLIENWFRQATFKTKNKKNGLAKKVESAGRTIRYIEGEVLRQGLNIGVGSGLLW